MNGSVDGRRWIVDGWMAGRWMEREVVRKGRVEEVQMGKEIEKGQAVEGS